MKRNIFSIFLCFAILLVVTQDNQAQASTGFTSAMCTSVCAENAGLRQNNPTNIEYTSQMLIDPWVGALTTKQGRFVTFEEPEYGFRAAFRTGLTYQNKHGLQTINERIGRWTSSAEHTTAELSTKINTIAKTMGISPNTPFDITDPTLGKAFIKGLTTTEVGEGYYSDKQIQDGYDLAFNYDPKDVGGIKNALESGDISKEQVDAALKDDASASASGDSKDPDAQQETLPVKNYIDEPGYGPCRPLRPNQTFFDIVNEALNGVNNDRNGLNGSGDTRNGEVRFSIFSGRHPDPNKDCAKEDGVPSGRHAHGMAGDGKFTLDGAVITDASLLAEIILGMRIVDNKLSIGYSMTSRTITHVDFEPSVKHTYWTYGTGNPPGEIINAMSTAVADTPSRTASTHVSPVQNTLGTILDKVTSSNSGGVNGLISNIFSIFEQGSGADNRISGIASDIMNIATGGDPVAGVSNIFTKILGRSDSGNGISNIFAGILGGNSSVGGLLSGLFGGNSGTDGVAGTLSVGEDGITATIAGNVTDIATDLLQGEGSSISDDHPLAHTEYHIEDYQTTTYDEPQSDITATALRADASADDEYRFRGSLTRTLINEDDNLSFDEISARFESSIENELFLDIHCDGVIDESTVFTTPYRSILPRSNGTEVFISEYLPVPQNGLHCFAFEVDINDDIDETNENNNMTQWKSFITNFNGAYDEESDTSLPDFMLEVSSYTAQGTVTHDWTTNDISIDANEELAFRWDAADYDSCIPFIYPVNYSFAEDVFTTVRDTDEEQIDVRELDKTYVVRCQLDGDSRSQSIVVDVQ